MQHQRNFLPTPTPQPPTPNPPVAASLRVPWLKVRTRYPSPGVRAQYLLFINTFVRALMAARDKTPFVCFYLHYLLGYFQSSTVPPFKFTCIICKLRYPLRLKKNKKLLLNLAIKIYFSQTSFLLDFFNAFYYSLSSYYSSSNFLLSSPVTHFRYANFCPHISFCLSS